MGRGSRGATHAHADQGVALPPAGASGGRVPRRASWPILVGIALVGLVLLLPDLTPVVQGGDSTVTAYHGRIESIVAPSGESDPDAPAGGSATPWSGCA